MTEHLQYLLRGILFIAVALAILATMLVVVAIGLLPAFLYIEVGVSWALWIYTIYFLIGAYLFGRYLNE